MVGNDGCKGRPEAATRSDIFSLVREMLFLSGKSQGIVQSDVCGNHDY